MPSFKYTARDLNGQVLTGVMEADTRDGVILSLRRQKYFPVKVEAEGLATKSFDFGPAFKKKVKPKDLAIFCRQFQTIMIAGISVIECLDILRQQSQNKMLKSAVNDMFQEVQKGIPLSQCMRKQKEAFPYILANMVEAGEASGRLPEIMDRMAIHYEKESRTSAKVMGALMYPMIISIVALGVVLLLLTVVLPRFIVMFDGLGVELPLPTLILLGFGQFMATYWYIVFVLMLLIGYFVYKFLSSDEGALKFDRIKLKIPVIGNTLKKVITSRFARTLSTMLSSGMSIIDAVEQVSKLLGNAYVGMKIEKSIESIKKGESISETLKSIEVFPPILISMIKVGEETGSLDTMLETTANFYEQELDDAIDKMIKMIEPIIIVFLAVVVGGIVMSVALPLFSMFDSMQF